MIENNHSVTSKKEEHAWLRDEILGRLGLSKDFFSMIFVVSGIFLPLALEYSGLIGHLVPVVGLALAFKLGGNDLRVGQLNFYLRRGLRSIWEIFRRYVFDGNKISRKEFAILQEQGLLLSQTEIKQIRRSLSPRFPSLTFWGDKWGFLVFYAISIGIGDTKTYRDVLHGDGTTIFLWVASFLSTALTIAVMARRRARDTMEDEENEEVNQFIETIKERGYKIERSLSYLVIEDLEGRAVALSEQEELREFVAIL